jgi:hypothetical protein
LPREPRLWSAIDRAPTRDGIGAADLASWASVGHGPPDPRRIPGNRRALAENVSRKIDTRQHANVTMPRTLGRANFRGPLGT